MPGLRGIAVGKDMKMRDQGAVVLSQSQAISMYLNPPPSCQMAAGLTDLCERVMRRACLKRLQELGITFNGTNATGMGDYDYIGPMYENHCLDGYIDQSEIKVKDFIQRYIFPVILFIGTVGNLTSVRYLHHLSVNVWSTCLYLAAMSLIDLLILYVDCGNKWFMVITGINLSEKISVTSEAICKVYPFVFQFFLHFSPWIIVACSVELAIASRFPHLTYKMCTRERAKAIMLLMTVLLVCLNMHFFWTYGLIKYPETQDKYISVCLYIEEFSEYFRDVIWPFMNLTVGHIAPLLVVTVCFFISLITFFKSDTMEKAKLEKYFMDLKSLQQLKVTFVVICLLYVTVTTMKILYMIVEHLMTQKVIVIPCSLESHVYAVMSLLGSLWDMLFYLFLSVKFFIYIATCSRFRNEISKLPKEFYNFFHNFHRKDSVTVTSGNNVVSKPLMNHGNNLRHGNANKKERSLRKGAGIGVTTAV